MTAEAPTYGTAGDDTITGSDRPELASGREGNDIMDGGNGADTLYGGSGNDTISGGQGNDVIYGGRGPELILPDEDGEGNASLLFLGETAGYRNTVGMYRIDSDGTVRDVTILFENASRVGSGGNLVPGETAVNLELGEDETIGFFIVPNGYGTDAALLDGEGSYELRHAETGEAATIQADAPMELWHVAADGRQRGPVPQTQLEKAVRAGQVPPDALVWRAGMSGWKAVREVPELAALFGAAPPPLPPG